MLAPRPVARPRKQGSTNPNSSTVLRPPFSPPPPSWADLEFGYLSKLGLNSQGFHKKWHLRIKSLGTPKATQGSPCPAGAAARRARQRQVNRWHIHDSPSQAREGGAVGGVSASPGPPQSCGCLWAGARCLRFTYLRSPPAAKGAEAPTS